MNWGSAVAFAASLFCFGNAMHTSRLLAEMPPGKILWIFEMQLFVAAWELWLGLVTLQ